MARKKGPSLRDYQNEWCGYDMAHTDTHLKHFELQISPFSHSCPFLTGMYHKYSEDARFLEKNSAFQKRLSIPDHFVKPRRVLCLL
jgi:hypothetical protein